MSTTDRQYMISPPKSLDHVAVWLSETIHGAAALGATDLHLFPATSAGEARLWLRIDGVLHQACVYTKAMHERAVSRLKVLARCPDYVREAVIEGRFTLATGANGTRAEARLSIIPSLTGEKAVIRLLGGPSKLPALAELGFSPALCDALSSAGARPQGLLLAVGPAGSGKSTTLAALLSHLFSVSPSPLAVLTLEDPPEIPMPFATQVAVDPERNLTFASGLRALLRQDPEIILVGEIRDPETAQVALNAALTGHRLLSSLHTLTAGEALARLLDMGAAPFMLASALGGILSQRLVRRVCPKCAAPVDSAPRPLDALIPEWHDAGAHAAVGCEACGGIGYAGRLAVGEWSVLGPESSAALATRHDARAIQQSLRVIAPATAEALALLERGHTTPDEIERLFLTMPPGGIDRHADT